MKHRKFIAVAAIVAVLLTIAGTALAAHPRITPSVTMHAHKRGQYTGVPKDGSIRAHGTYAYNSADGVSRCGPLAGHPVTMYDTGGPALGGSTTGATGNYWLNTHALAPATYHVYVRVPGKYGGKYGHNVICYDAVSRTATISIP